MYKLESSKRVVIEKSLFEVRNRHVQNFSIGYKKKSMFSSSLFDVNVILRKNVEKINYGSIFISHQT